jgi:flagellar motor switch protein FliN/FliY
VSDDPADPTPQTLEVAIDAASFDAGPLGELPYLAGRQVRLQERMGKLNANPTIASAVEWFTETTGVKVALDRAEVLWRAAGIKRTGAVAQVSWPRLATRFGLGIETPIAHACVDRMLGYERLPEEGRLQITPVEWGILTFLVAETLARLGEDLGTLGPCDFVLDRVGPDPFNTDALGAIVTLRWPVRLGLITGSIRLWLPESLLDAWLSLDVAPPPADPEQFHALRGRFGSLASEWHGEAAHVNLPRGLTGLRKGSVLPIDEAAISGTPQTPIGPIVLALRDPNCRFVFPVEAVPASGGRLLKITEPLRKHYLPREAIPVSTTPESKGAAEAGPAEIPVTLTVELGRVNLPLSRLADLKAGDVVELGRHAREPVELTSNGKLVARGELVQIDTELGVRVLNVFL